MSVYRFLERAALVAGDQTAVALGAQPLHSFRQLARRAQAIAGGLRQRHGLEAGDRVALVMSNVPEYIEILFACWRAGLAAVPINAKLHGREIAYMLGHSGARIAFVSPELEGVMAEAVAAADCTPEAIIETGSRDYRALLNHSDFAGDGAAPDDLAWLFYTSGTTGRPKGAMLSHQNLAAMSLSYFIDIDTIAPGDSIVHAAPLSHGSGLYVLPHMAAMARQIIPESGGFDPGELLSLIAAHGSPEGGVSMFAAPTMVNRLVNHGAMGHANLAGLKAIVYGGAPMHVADVHRALDALGPRLAQLYGQGESPMCITGLNRRWYGRRDHPRFDEIIGSAGFAQSVVDVAVMDGDEKQCATGETGEICVRGSAVMSGYWLNPEASREALRGGWLHSGDIGRFDHMGFLTLLDRSKDLIISGGSNIYPREVEEVLLRHPAVYEVAVIGCPHADWGEEVIACVVTHPGLAVKPGELDAMCQAEIARFKRPKAYHFMAELPKSAYGKILKRLLRDQLAAQRQSG